MSVFPSKVSGLPLVGLVPLMQEHRMVCKATVSVANALEEAACVILSVDETETSQQATQIRMFPFRFSFNRALSRFAVHSWHEHTEDETSGSRERERESKDFGRTIGNFHFLFEGSKMATT